jgi:hypothetical protein
MFRSKKIRRRNWGAQIALVSGAIHEERSIMRFNDGSFRPSCTMFNMSHKASFEMFLTYMHPARLLCQPRTAEIPSATEPTCQKRKQSQRASEAYGTRNFETDV